MLICVYVVQAIVQAINSGEDAKIYRFLSYTHDVTKSTRKVS